MLFIAEDPLQYVIRTERPAVHDPAGRMIAEKQRRIVIQFSRGTAPQWVKEIAVKTFEFRKRPVEIPVETWVSYYDTIEDQVSRGWTDEEREEIERVLSTAFDVLKIEPPEIQKPWPTIDKLRSADKIVETAEDIGVELQVVVDYLRAKDKQALADQVAAKIPVEDEVEAHEVVPA